MVVSFIGFLNKILKDIPEDILIYQVVVITKKENKTATEIICTEQGHELKDHSFQRTASRNVLEFMQIPLLKSFPNAIKTLFWILYSYYFKASSFLLSQELLTCSHKMK